MDRQRETDIERDRERKKERDRERESANRYAEAAKRYFILFEEN